MCIGVKSAAVEQVEKNKERTKLNIILIYYYCCCQRFNFFRLPYFYEWDKRRALNVSGERYTHTHAHSLVIVIAYIM